jgi:succinate dehydrogenase / fumarate reductase cytochrome b subunit
MSANRPLSPHLQVYRLPLTGIISISHRIAGVLLSLGLALVVYMLFAIASGEDSYLAMQAFMDFWLCRLLYWGFIYALFFHLCHGIRHLLWDVGKNFERGKLDRLATYELAASAGFTLLTYFLS